MIQFYLNDRKIETSLPPGMPLLDFIRNNQRLPGTKTGCREGDCGACTILVGELQNDSLRYRSATSCLMPLGNAMHKHIVTIEGLNMEHLNPAQEAIVEEDATQCGFCTPGFVVSLSGFMLENKKAEYADAIASMDGNICRCTGYKSLERAAGQLVAQLGGKAIDEPIQWLVEAKCLPPYFLNIKKLLYQLKPTSKLESVSSENAIIIGGGTDLFVQKPGEMYHRELKLFSNNEDLKYIHVEEGNCHIGASVSTEQLMHSDVMLSIFPRLKAHMKLISSTPIRNMATVAGNFVNASPIGDLSIFFLALDSSLVIKNAKEKREVKLNEFFKGYKKIDLHKGEYVQEVYFKIPKIGADCFFNFEKVSKRTHLDIASVNSACLIKIENGTIVEAHLSAGGVSPIPLYLKKSAQAICGKSLNMETFKEVNEIIQKEIAPISDVRGSAEYKRLLLKQLFFAHEAVTQ